LLSYRGAASAGRAKKQRKTPVWGVGAIIKGSPDDGEVMSKTAVWGGGRFSVPIPPSWEIPTIKGPEPH